MFNYKRKEEAQEAVAGDKRARVQPQQQLLLRATEPALQHNQAAILVCCINTHTIYTILLYTIAIAIAVHLFAFDVPELHLHASYLRQFHVMKFSLYFAHLRIAFFSLASRGKTSQK